MQPLLTSSFPHVVIGDSLALVGPSYIVAVVRIDSPAGLAVAAWVDLHGSFELADYIELPDGRVAVLLARLDQ